MRLNHLSKSTSLGGDLIETGHVVELFFRSLADDFAIYTYSAESHDT
jgi:hypothetical protein